MNALYVLLALCFAAPILAADNGVVSVLTDSSFDEAVSASELSLVEFFAPWCGHCKKLAPEFAAASTELEGEVLLASVDCTVEKALCAKYEVKGFPTLKVFRGDVDDAADYGGGRVTAEIVKYMRKQNEPAYHVLDTQEALDAFLTKEVAITAYVADVESEDAKTFIDVANKLRDDYSFALFTAESDKVGTIVLTKAGEDESASLDTFETEAIKSFIATESFPLVGVIGPENFGKYVARGFPLVWVFCDYESGADALLESVAVVAKGFKSTLSFVQLDGVKWGDHGKNFGLTSTTPGVVIEDRANKKNYLFAGEFETEALQAWVDSYAAGTLEPNVKSEEIPEDNTDPVTVVVGKQFDEIVMDDSKDVLVEFYAPWCGHCKSLAPKWEKLGEEFEDEDNVVIAKIDATANDHPADVKGFPTLIFYPAGDKSNPVKYEGAREVSAMADWIRDRSTVLGDVDDEVASTAHDEL